MKITTETVDKLSVLAKLEFDGSAKEEILADLNRILQFIEKLNELDTKDVAPLIYMSDEVNRLREDVVLAHVSQKEGLLNGPKHDSDYFRTPKVKH